MSGRLARNAMSGVAQVAVSAVALFLMYRLLMDWLTVQEIGLWSLVVGTTAVARLSELGIGNGVLRFVASDIGRGDRTMAARTVGMAIALVTVVVGLVALVAQPFLLHYLLRTTPAALHPGVNALLPAALGALVLGTMGNIFMSALDGCQRMDLRAVLQMLSALVQLVATFLVLPRYGLLGLGLVQIAQGVFLLVTGCLCFFLQLRQPLRTYFGWDRARLKEVLVYGGGVQLAGIAQLLLDPALKVLLNTFAGLTLTGYYDIGNRVAMQVRSLIVAAYNALVPHVAARVGQTGGKIEEIRATYIEALNLLYFAVIPYFAAVFAVLPMALIVWKGHYDPTLLMVTVLQCFAWFLNTISPPAYLLYVALGRIRWNVLTHFFVGALVVALGLVLGPVFGGPGVLAGGAVALALGSLFVVYMFHREYGVSLGLLLQAHRLPEMALLLFSVASCAWIASRPEAPGWAIRIGLPLLVGTVAAARLWWDPMRRSIFKRLGGALA